MLPTIGTTELIIILVIVLIVFGVGRIPQVGRGIGQGIREFRESINILKENNRSSAQPKDTETTEGLKS